MEQLSDGELHAGGCGSRPAGLCQRGNRGGGAAADTLRLPRGVASNGTQLFIADQTNNRVLVWNSFPTANGAAADVVLGQGDFSHTARNDDNQDGITDQASARTLAFPSGVTVAGDRLIVTDTFNNRYLIFAGL